MVCTFGDARITRRAVHFCTLEGAAVLVIAVVAGVVVSLLPLLSCRGGGWEWG